MNSIVYNKRGMYLLIVILQIKCAKCHGKSERQERMMDLTVEIEGDIGNLEEALRRYTGTEILDGENKYKCDRLVWLLMFGKFL